ncbi:hypothetical protein U1Q18_038629 [Sarracenia purpurea var. burkii]
METEKTAGLTPLERKVKESFAMVNHSSDLCRQVDERAENGDSYNYCSQDPENEDIQIQKMRIFKCLFVIF